MKEGKGRPVIRMKIRTGKGRSSCFDGREGRGRAAHCSEEGREGDRGVAWPTVGGKGEGVGVTAPGHRIRSLLAFPPEG